MTKSEFKYKPSIITSLWLLLFISFSSVAGDKRIYKTDSYGNIQYHKPSYTLQSNGRVIETDRYGNKLYQKQQYQIKSDTIYETDSLGNIQYQKPHSKIK